MGKPDFMLSIPKDPEVKRRARWSKKTGRFYKPGGDHQYALDVAHYWREKYGKIAPIRGPVALSITFVIKRPKRLMRRKDPPGRIMCAKRPDLTNLVQAIEDALNNIAWVDDGQIWSKSEQKVYASMDEHPHVEIAIWEFDDEGAVEG